LNSTLRNGSYDTTVKTVEPCRTDFISRVELIEPQFGIAPGQACVFYQGSRVLGGGWIQRESAAKAA